MNDSDRKEIVEKLWPLIESGDCVIWVGSGLSIGAYQSWIEAVYNVCKACNVKRLPCTKNLPAKAEECQNANFSEFKPSKACKEKGPPCPQRTEEMLAKAEECRKANFSEYKRCLHSLYGGRKTMTRKAYQYIAKLPAQAYVTTNFDLLLAEATEMEKKQNPMTHPCLPLAYPNLKVRWIEKCPGSAFYLHGCANGKEIEDDSGLVFSSSEFARAYDDEKSELPSFVRQIFGSYSILFIGCQITEENLEKTLRRSKLTQEAIRKSISSSEHRPHYLLLPNCRLDDETDISISDKKREAKSRRNEEARQNMESGEDSRFREMGIEVLRFPNEDGKFTDIDEILIDLWKHARDSRKRQPFGRDGGQVPDD